MDNVNKVTPYKDITWYIKWIVSAIMLVGITCRASNVSTLHPIDLVCSFIGAAGWGWVGFKWNDRAMMLTSSLNTLLLGAGIIKLFFA